jgi:hypothetical protein
MDNAAQNTALPRSLTVRSRFLGKMQCNIDQQASSGMTN